MKDLEKKPNSETKVVKKRGRPKSDKTVVKKAKVVKPRKKKGKQKKFNIHIHIHIFFFKF